MDELDGVHCLIPCAPGLTSARARRHTSDAVYSAPAFRVVATVTALAVALVGLLPFQHVHADDHQQVVHRHVIGDGSGHHDDFPDLKASADRSEHADARILTLSFETARSVCLTALGPVAALFADEAVATPPLPIVGTTILPTHDPPLRFVSSPAPPAVV